MRDGKIVVSFDRKGSLKEMVVDTKTSLDDGDWHTLVVNKNKQRITVTVDGNSKKGAKIAKVLKVDVPLFVGGVPSSFASLMNAQVVSVPLFFTITESSPHKYYTAVKSEIYAMVLFSLHNNISEFNKIPKTHLRVHVYTYHILVWA